MPAFNPDVSSVPVSDSQNFTPDLATIEPVKKQYSANKAVESQGFRLSAAVDRALFALTIALTAVASAALTATIVLASNIAFIALIVSSIAIGLLIISQTLSLVRPYLPTGVGRIVDNIRAIVVDFFAALTLGSFLIQDLEKKDPKTVPANGQQPILLVHGYLGHSSNWTYMRYRLQQAGLGPVFTINLGSVFQSIDGDYALKVKQKAEEIAKITGMPKLTIIGHSMGGVIASYYATHLAPKGSVTDIITLGSPMKGTKFSAIEVGECAEQMNYRSDFIKKLLDKIYSSEDIRFYNFGSEADEIILPNSAALLDASKMKSKLKTHMFSDLGHVSYPLSDMAADKMIDYIKQHQAVSSSAV